MDSCRDRGKDKDKDYRGMVRYGVRLVGRGAIVMLIDNGKNASVCCCRVRGKGSKWRMKGVLGR